MGISWICQLVTVEKASKNLKKNENTRTQVYK